ncbi:MAG TPA: hypothetical protein V6D29_14465 [Leptolyngbyaceae cyanobacterium]
MSTFIPIQTLKQNVLRFWTMLHTSTASVCQSENFKPEVRKLFGDLRRKNTWEKAFAHFYVQWVLSCAADGDIFFKLMDPNRWAPWQQALRFFILEALLTDRKAEEVIGGSYESLAVNNRTELANGLLELAREGRGTDQPTALLSQAGVS